MRIDNINKALFNENLDEKKKTSKIDGDFGSILKNTLEDVNRLQIESAEAKEKLILGEVENLHEVSIIAEKADIALQVTLAIRGKVIEAYKEILRMQV